MTRPRKQETRQHQVNLRFTTAELVRIHRHAALTGKTPTDFGRSVMLRRPRPRRKPGLQLIALAPERLTRWQALGSSVNAIAHEFHLRNRLDARALRTVITRLRILLRQAFPGHFQDNATLAPYALTPEARIQLRRICTNLVQIADRYRLNGLEPPLVLSHLVYRFRAILNGDAAHDS
jgi:hypothetical protein